jgi:tetratricopeptide (TPR) repeat protein
LEEPDQGLPAALRALEGAGLVDVERPELDPTQMAGLQEVIAHLAEQAGEELDPEELAPAELPGLLEGLTAGAASYTIHPGVAEAARAEAQPAVLDAADIEMGDFHRAMFWQAIEQEMEGQGGTVVTSARRAAPYLMRQARWEAAATLLEQMLARDRSPATLAFALPLLRRVAEATAGTERELIDAGILANALMMAGRADEAERMLRDLVDRSADRGDYRLASGIAGVLLNLLQSRGRLEEALAVAEEKAGYTGRAGLGPWTQLGDETMRLQVLAALGRYEEVLEEVARLRPRMEGLSMESEAEETVNPWNVRETLLNVGCKAAVRSERWERALALNAEVLRVNRERGADALELARARFNDYFPLLRLERYDEARELLLGCRAVFEDERDVLYLGKVYSALADLEHRTGDRAAAVRFEQVALGYRYRAGQPEDCAISHNNLAEHLARRGADAADVLAHRLAAAAIWLQTRSGQIRLALGNLAKSDLPPAPPAFAAVARRVERIEGVRFRALFERLPSRVPDGDAAIAAVWQLVGEEQRSRGAEEQRRREVLASMPPAVQAAFELDGEAFSAALRAALDDMPEDEAANVLRRLREAELISGGSSGPDMERVLRDFGPLLQGIAAAVEEEGLRGELEPVLAQLEENGWRLREAAHRIWAGERDEAALTAGLDDQDSALVRRVLALLAGEQRSRGAEGQGSKGAEVQRGREVLASMPPAVQSAFELDGEAFSAALRAALDDMPEDEAGSVLRRLREADLISGGSSGPDMERVLRDFGPLLQGIAGAVEDEGLRGELEPVLAQVEESGWMLREAAHRIWAGERDEAALTADIDPNSAQLVRRVLALLAG